MMHTPTEHRVGSRVETRTGWRGVVTAIDRDNDLIGIAVDGHVIWEPTCNVRGDEEVMGGK